MEVEGWVCSHVTDSNVYIESSVYLYQLPLSNSVYFLALDFVSYQSKEKHCNFKTKQGLFNSEGNSRKN